MSEAEKLLIDRTELSENERCYRYLIGKIAMNSNRFDATKGIEKWGFIKDKYICFYIPAFEDRLEEKGFSRKSFLSWAKSNGIVATDSGRDTKIFKIDGKNYRCIAIKMKEEISVDEDGFLKIDSTDELPFD